LVNKINVIKETDEVMDHITDRGNKNMIKELITRYKTDKFEEIGIELNIV